MRIIQFDHKVLIEMLKAFGKLFVKGLESYRMDTPVIKEHLHSCRFNFCQKTIGALAYPS